jgi:cold shock CspA family protein
MQRTPLRASAAIDKSHPDVFLLGWELRNAGINRVAQGDVLSFFVQPASKGPMAVDVELSQ